MPDARSLKFKRRTPHSFNSCFERALQIIKIQRARRTRAHGFRRYSFIDAGTDDRFAFVPDFVRNDSGGEASFVTLRNSIIEGATRMRPVSNKRTSRVP